MKILAIDTTSELGGVGVFDGGEIRSVVANDRPTNLYSVSLFDMAERALRDSESALREIDLFAVSNGPGSFTGIRIGIAAAQGWARAFGRPVAGVSSLQAMVEAAGPSADWAFPILDAHRGEFYAASYRRSGASAFEAVDEGLIIESAEVANLPSRVPAGASAGIAWIVRESDAAAGALRESLAGAGQWIVVPGTLLPAIAAIALRENRDGQNHPPDELRPRYIRKPYAELNWRG